MAALTKPVLNTKVDEVTPLVDYITAVFGSKQRADLWMSSSNFNLKGKTPKQVINTKIGREKITDMLLAVHHGIY